MTVYPDHEDVWNENYAIFLADSEFRFYGTSQSEFWHDFQEYLKKEFPDVDKINHWPHCQEFEIQRNGGKPGAH